MLRAAGHHARLLDVRVDDFGGPYDAVLADAVLLHVIRKQFVDVLQRARQAVASGGVLAITLKEGDGETWTEAKFGRPRHFTYWRGPAVRAALVNTGWHVLSLEHVARRVEPWDAVFAEPDGGFDVVDWKTGRRPCSWPPTGWPGTSCQGGRSVACVRPSSTSAPARRSAPPTCSTPRACARWCAAYP